MKRHKSSSNLCPKCGRGTTHQSTLDYTLTDENGKEVTVPNLEVEICDFCGERIFNMQAVRKVRQSKGQQGKILIRLKPTIQTALAARAQKNKRSLTQEAQHLLETSLQP